jgi:hypothetical protein
VKAPRPRPDFGPMMDAAKRAEAALVAGVQVDPAVNTALLIQCVKGLSIVMDGVGVLHDKFDAVLEALSKEGA